MTTMTAQTTQVYSVFIRATPSRCGTGSRSRSSRRGTSTASVIDSTYEPGAPYRGWSVTARRQYVDGDVIEADRPRKLVHDVARDVRPRDRSGAARAG